MKEKVRKGSWFTWQHKKNWSLYLFHIIKLILILTLSHKLHLLLRNPDKVSISGPEISGANMHTKY